MVSELKWEIRKMQNGGIRITITSAAKQPNQLLRNARDYAEKFRKHLDRAGDFTEIRIHINSAGGNANSAFGMMDVLDQAIRRTKVPVATLIEGTCGSAATMALAAKGPTYITAGSSVFVHRASMAKWAKKKGVWAKIHERIGVDWVENYLMCTYRAACKYNGHRISRKQAREWMAAGTRFSAEEAVAAGLCTAIKSRDQFDREELR